MPNSHCQERYSAVAMAGTSRTLLDRGRVLALDRGLPIIVFDAPSGYGKTVLADLWLERQRTAAICGWVAVDASSGDPVLFLDQLLSAVGAESPERIEAGIDDEAQRAERFAQLCAHLGAGEARHCLVIDDAHLLAGGASRSYLERLLALASERLRICLTMQPVKVELGLGGLAARGFVTWIQANNLALSAEEVARFAELRGQRLSAVQLDWLVRATEGWPALTQLALAVPLEARSGAAVEVAGIGPLREYIYERFIGGLSADEREVLWMLACLGSAPVALLVAVDTSPTKIELALLRFRALGIVQNRDPDDPAVVCLHGLIREGATRLLDQRQLRGRRELLQAAADWYWRNGEGALAVRLALEEGVALAPLARGWLVALGFNFIFRTGQHQTLLDLVERLEQVAADADPEIDELVAWALIFQRQFTAAAARLARIEAAGPPAARMTAQLQRAVLVALRDDFRLGGELAKGWIDQNRGSQTFPMGVASTVYAFSLRFSGCFDEAHVALREAMYCFNLAQSAYGIGWAHSVGAVVLIQTGRYRAALAQVEAGLARCPGSQGYGPLRTMMRASEAFLRYERNELDRVREILGEVLPMLADQGVVDSVSHGYIAASRARAAAGDYGTALDILSEGEQVALQRDFPRLNVTLRAERALLLLRSGAVNQARNIVDNLAGTPPGTTIGLLHIRLAIADGEGERGRHEAQAMVNRLRAIGRQSRLCEALLQLAAAADLCGDEGACHAALAEALEIGSIEGYVRSFLDEGRLIASLIRRWLKTGGSGNRPALALAERLTGPVEAPVERDIVDLVGASLNKRERQILGLLNEGLSNAQLAKRCFISEGTVKWYLHNLYEKLGVNNRTALLRAVREQGVKL